MVLTGLIRAVKPNTKAFKQNNLKSAQLLSLEGAQTGEKTKDDKCQECRLKVSKYQNENMKSSHCPKYERKNLKNGSLGYR